jgi:hypothetical protein
MASIISSIHKNDITAEWTDNAIELLSKWRNFCDAEGTCHKNSYVKKKRLHCMISIPTIIVPVAMASFGQLYNSCLYFEAQVANSTTYLITGIFGGLSTFLNYGQAYESHAQAEVRYHELRNEIDAILISRISTPSLVIEYVRTKLELLNKTSPDV